MVKDDDSKPDTDLQISMTEGEGWMRTLTVTVPEARVAKARAAEARQLSGSVKLKGFRKGKVPTDVVEQRFGEEIDDRVRQRLLDEAYREALKEAELSPAGPGRITDIRYASGEPFIFKAELEVMPRVKLQRTGGFQVSRTVAPVTEEEVDEILDQIRGENADWVPVERKPVPGERVSVRISPLEAGSDTPTGESTPYQLVLGEGKALDDVEEAIRSLKPGESGIFAVEFPVEEGEAEEDEGTVTRRLHVALETVEEKDLPEMTDELAAEVGDFSSVAELEEAVRQDLARHHEEQAEEKVRGQLMEALREANPFVVPQALVDRYMQNMVQAQEDTAPEELRRMREAVGPHAERQIRDQLLIEAIIEEEELRPSRGEVEAHIAKLAEQRDASPDRLRRELAREGRMDALRQNLAVEKAFTYLKDQSSVG